MSKLWVLNLAYDNSSKTFIYDTEYLALEQLHILFLGICNSILEEPQELVSTYRKSNQEIDDKYQESKFAHWEITDKLKWFEFSSDDFNDHIDDIPNKDLVIFRLLPQVKEMYIEAIQN